ncbi:MAG: hypothetical protein ACI94Y_001474 [Maribacter sp.]
MRILIYISFILLLSHSLASAQRRPPAKEKAVAKITNDTISPLKKDSSVIIDTINIPTNVNYAKDPLESEIDYFAEDSMLFNVLENKIYLYGNAIVKYESFELKAAFIIFDQKNNIVIAEGMPDSLGNMAGNPDFKDGEQKFKAKKMTYNYKTKKGLISEVTTTQNDLYVHSGTLKYQKGGEEGHNHAEDVIYSENSMFTTCDHIECPHFGLRSKKQKVIANKMIVTGPTNLEIAGVSTPIWLPFGFFPLNKDKSSGLLFPKDYENSEQWGFGLKDIGYYWAINDKIDLQVTGQIYTRGTWRINTKTKYKVKYKYNGSLDFQYGWNYNQEVAGEIGRKIDKTTYINWIFNQDMAANPNYSFNASVNFSINQAQQVNNNDYNNVFNNNTSRSNITFRKPFKNNTMNLVASINHSQVNSTRSFNLDLPNIKFTVNRFTPFKKKIQAAGGEKWYEKIGFRYSTDVLTKINTRDTLLFTPEVFDDIRYGIKHKADMDASFRVFKYFNLNPSIKYSESWFIETLDKDYLTEISYNVDTIYDPITEEIIDIDSTEVVTNSIDTTYTNGFQPLRLFEARLSLSTEIFSTLRFKKGKIEGIRYTMRPNIGFSYTPDYTQDGWGYVNSYERGDDDVQYSRFEGNVFNDNPSRNGLRMNLNYGIVNILEAKYKSKKDSVEQSKIVKLFDNLRVNGSYNFAADSLNFSDISASSTTRLFKGISTITLSGSFSPYVLNEEGRKINTTRWSTDKRLLRFKSLSTRITTNISWNHIKEWFGLDSKQDNEQEENKSPGAPNNNTNNNNNNGRQGQNTNYGSRFINNVSLSHSFNLTTNKDGTEITTNSIRLQGEINLSSKWQFNVRNIGYNFKTKSIVYPDISISRDLHCWQMGMSWQPQRGTYSFYLKVNPGSLDFISVPWNKNQYDAGFK